MKLNIRIVALDEENGLKKTMEETIEVPRAALKMLEVLHGSDPVDRVVQVATDAMIGARKPFDTTRANQKSRMTEVVEGGGKVGGPKAGRRKDGSTDPMAAALGLDMIQKMNQPTGPSGPVSGFTKDRR